MKIVFTGGGTLGSVSPLLAVYEYVKNEGRMKATLWIGTKSGPERNVVQAAGISFRAISAGKLRRYFDWMNFFDPLLIAIGILQSFFLILVFRPDAIVHAGSFVGVPVVAAGWLLGKKIVIVQLDITPTLSNRIVVPFAKSIAVATGGSIDNFPKNKTYLTGIPIRKAIIEKTGDPKKILHQFAIAPPRKIVLIVGGGTGARGLNELVIASLKHMNGSYDVIHLTGRGKRIIYHESPSWYHSLEFVITGMEDYLAAATIAVSRAGMGMIGEIAATGIPAILVPLPDSHQEMNAAYFERHGAVRYVGEKRTVPHRFAQEIEQLLNDEQQCEAYVKKMNELLSCDGARGIAELL